MQEQQGRALWRIMRIIAVVFGECYTILLAFYFHHSEKVERFPRNKPNKTICRAIPGKRMLDPGSSLFRPHHITQPWNKANQTTYRVITACEPWSSAQGWQSPFATETGGLIQTGNSVASAEQTSAALILSAWTAGKPPGIKTTSFQADTPDPVCLILTNNINNS